MRLDEEGKIYLIRQLTKALKVLHIKCSDYKRLSLRYELTNYNISYTQPIIDQLLQDGYLLRSSGTRDSKTPSKAKYSYKWNFEGEMNYEKTATIIFDKVVENILMIENIRNNSIVDAVVERIEENRPIVKETKKKIDNKYCIEFLQKSGAFEKTCIDYLKSLKKYKILEITYKEL